MVRREEYHNRNEGELTSLAKIGVLFVIVRVVLTDRGCNCEGKKE